MDLFPNEQNFDLNKSRQTFHHSLKEHHKISNIPKFLCEMLQNADNIVLQSLPFFSHFVLRTRNWYLFFRKRYQFPLLLVSYYINITIGWIVIDYPIWFSSLEITLQSSIIYHTTKLFSTIKAHTIFNNSLEVKRGQKEAKAKLFFEARQEK